MGLHDGRPASPFGIERSVVSLRLFQSVLFESKLLRVYSPHDTKNFKIALLFLLKPKLRRRSIKEIENAIPAFKTYGSGLGEAEDQFLRRNLFGQDRGAVDSPSMKRFFKSTLELGCPQSGELLSVVGVR